MSVHFDNYDQSLVIDGWQNGISPDPYDGISNMQSVNPISIQGEVSSGFSTKSVTKAPVLTNVTATVTTTGNNLMMPVNATLESYQWVIFSAVGTSGLSTNTPYMLFWNGNDGFNTKYQLYLTTAVFPPSGSAVTIIGNSSVTFSVIGPTLPKYFVKSLAYNFILDSSGRVWSDRYESGSGGGPSTTSWVYIGNPTDTTSNGNGIVVYQTVHDGTGGSGTSAGVDEWLFVWRNSQIDYTQLTSNGSNTTITWVSGWNPNTASGTTTGFTQYLQTSSAINNSHMAIVTPDGRVDYCDANFIGVFYQNVPTPGDDYVGFNPATAGTWTFSLYTILPFDDTAQCISFLNQYLLIGGKQNIIYPWDLFDVTYSTPLILLPESNVVNLVTVGNNGYIFAGNRGNIYVTNGSQASLFTKVPDHISGEVEPLFSWGGATYNKNRLYFGVQSTNQEGGVMPPYGGIWCVDISTGAIFNSNQLSYGSYLGYASALGVVQNSGIDNANPSLGYGLVAGWVDGTGAIFGVDISISAPYTNGASIIESDLIPIGTYTKPRTVQQIEYRLSVPLVSGESITVNYRNFYGDSWKSVYTDSTVGNYSARFPATWKNSQWLQIQIILTSVANSPSYVRLKEIRLLGMVGPTLAQNQNLSA